LISIDLKFDGTRDDRSGRLKVRPCPLLPLLLLLRLLLILLVPLLLLPLPLRLTSRCARPTAARRAVAAR